MKTKNNKEVLINVLTRTSNRPIGFNNCYYSVANQTYKNIRHIVSYDDDLDLNYISNYDVEAIKVWKLKNEQSSHPEGFTTAPYNLYCNELLDCVTDGWILFLDDDVNIFHNKVFQEIVSFIKDTDENTMLIWQIRYPDGTVLPSKEIFKKQEIKAYNIDSACFLFHSKYKEKVRWDGWKVSDYRFINALSEIIPNKKWIERVFIQVNNYGDLGQRNDIKNVNNTLIFNKTFFWYLIPKYHFKLFGLLVFRSDTFLFFFFKLRITVRYRIKKMTKKIR